MTSSKRILQKIIGNKRFGGKNDWDFDGVINKKDCQPRNTMRQDNFIGRSINWMKGNAQELDFWKRYSTLKPSDQMKVRMEIATRGAMHRLAYTENKDERKKLKTFIKDNQDILQAIR